MPASLPENGDEQIGCRIHNKRMLVELRGGVHEPAEAQALAGAPQIPATGCFQLGYDIEQGKTGSFMTLFQCEFASQPALEAKVIAPERALNADEESASLLKGNVISDRSCQRRQRQSELPEALLDVTQFIRHL